MKPLDSHKGVSKPRTLGHLYLGRDRYSSLTYLGVQQHTGEVTRTHTQKTKVCFLYHESQWSMIQFLNCFLFREHVFWAGRDQHSKDKPCIFISSQPDFTRKKQKQRQSVIPELSLSPWVRFSAASLWSVMSLPLDLSSLAPFCRALKVWDRVVLDTLETISCVKVSTI